MRYLGLDLGSKTLGMAISDPTGLIASSYKIIRHNEDYSQLIDEISTIITQENIDEIVLGLPKHMNNDIGEKGQLSIWFQKELEAKTHLPVHLEDERLTTRQAESLLIHNDTSRKKRKQVIDAVAATIILQSYLDRKRRE